MTVTSIHGGSPFDAIRQTRDDGTEFWSARDLQPFMGYSKWQDFQNAIERAKAAAINAGQDADGLFVQVSKVMDAGNLGPQDRVDYEMPRFACYLVFLNGDPRKPEVAAAQAYFAIKTREAEVAPPVVRELSFEEQTLLVVTGLQDRVVALTARAEIAEAEVEELTPAATAWRDICSGAGSFAAREAAQMLCNVGIIIGQNRLLAALDELGWTFRQGGERRIRQTAREAQLLEHKAYPPRYKPSGERIQVQPQIRITGKGLDRLARELGNAS